MHTPGSPDSQRFELGLERWLADMERFAPQLHKVKHADYTTMKRSQHHRQQVVL